MELLEHNSVMWWPQTKGDITVIENVQRRFSIRVPERRNLSYKERLNKLIAQMITVWSNYVLQKINK